MLLDFQDTGQKNCTYPMIVHLNITNVCTAMFLWLGVPEHTWNLEVQKKQTEEIQNLLLLANPRI